MSVGSGPVTITRCFGVLASILDDAVADRLLVVNPPARGVKLPRRKRGEQTYLTMAQLQALAEQAGGASRARVAPWLRRTAVR